MSLYRPPGSNFNITQMPHLSAIGSLGGIASRVIGGGTLSSAVWSTANRAIFVPIMLPAPYMVRRCWFLVGATGGTDSVDMGIYDAAGSRIVSSGGATVGTANQIQYRDVTDTEIGPGMYYIAIAMNGTTATAMRGGFGQETMKITGALMMASAYVLPATATYASITTGNVPIVGITNRASP